MVPMVPMPPVGPQAGRRTLEAEREAQHRPSLICRNFCLARLANLDRQKQQAQLMRETADPSKGCGSPSGTEGYFTEP
jgi:hypothetical protein